VRRRFIDHEGATSTPTRKALVSDALFGEDRGMAVVVTPIPCLSDNYAYLVHAEGSQDALVVDASEAGPVLAALREADLRPRAILSTHHHADHVGGNLEVLAEYPEVVVLGSDYDRARIPGLGKALAHQEVFDAAGLRGRALSVPGHTLGAVAFVLEDTVFTGDTLFIAGCGRLFEGDAAMMARSLVDELAALPDATRVYCGHEYTTANARFAASVDSDNEAVRALLARAEAARSAGRPTVPSTIGDERRHNPFLRVADAAFRAALGEPDRDRAFAKLRKAKDAF
jgi:hydroxyacylglutathione hydrolase